ncbi:hypothetical protein [Thermaerobacter composti]|uniref:SPOR domain-containing protein n=1 Tax=Thermaerobacter composti TaxID=554949 RepID=A0ABZ0QNE1_9FIRM|nr:hypothetical protein [Thermaerobacter composti]WPD18022.1 hypothetical protein Q5761_06390 [Thermaerobacter composti]
MPPQEDREGRGPSPGPARRASSAPAAPAGRQPSFQQPALFATFRDVDGAQRAAEALKAAGYRDVQIDRLEPVREERGDLTDQPMPKTLTGAMDRDRRALAAMDPTVSGLADDELVGAMPYLMVVPLADGQSRQRAAAIVRRHGGRV